MILETETSWRLRLSPAIITSLMKMRKIWLIGRQQLFYGSFRICCNTDVSIFGNRRHASSKAFLEFWIFPSDGRGWFSEHQRLFQCILFFILSWYYLCTFAVTLVCDFAALLNFQNLLGVRRKNLELVVLVSCIFNNLSSVKFGSSDYLDVFRFITHFN